MELRHAKITHSGCEWRYQKLQVIVFFVVFRTCMCTCLSVAHQRNKQA